jgi:flavin reductase (DIM6/NTAB) family NADH-FMN oxidoreductase RutF
VNKDAFDALMAGADSAMVVVTVSDGDERAGCLVGFHTQCSIDPPRFAVWVSKANHTCRVALRSSHLAVHFLGGDDRDLAELFGGETGDEVDKFEAVDWEPGPGGVPVLRRCDNRVVLRRLVLLDESSDHLCIVAEPVDAACSAGFMPLRLGAVTDIDPGHDADER